MSLPILNVLTVILDEETREWSKTAEYLEQQGININRVAGFCGSPTVTPITLLQNQRFDLPDHGSETVDGVVIEARGEDGETVIDLVAWPISNPTDVRTMLGQAPMVGLWEALNPSTYTFNYPLVVQRTPLDWAKADCQGAAVVMPKLAARTFQKVCDMGGRIGAQDAAHALELRNLLQALVDQVEIVIPKLRRAA